VEPKIKQETSENGNLTPVWRTEINIHGNKNNSFLTMYLGNLSFYIYEHEKKEQKLYKKGFANTGKIIRLMTCSNFSTKSCWRA
jgi:hypothetical protein